MSAVRERVQEMITKGMIRKTRNRKTKKFIRKSVTPHNIVDEPKSCKNPEDKNDRLEDL
jgi:hypothetical protein